MPDENDSSESPFHSVRDLRGWLSEEVRNSVKACELRLREATDFVTAYAMGDLTAEQAQKRLLQYQDRWGEPLPGGTIASSYKSDEAIVEAIDRYHATWGSRKWVQEEGYRRQRGEGTGSKETER